jgi:Lipocalin-like domain
MGVITATLTIVGFAVFSAAVLEHTNDTLVGTWKLVSVLSTTSAGERDETPYGSGPVGLLTYSRYGRVTALISYGGRRILSVGADGLAPLEERAEAFKTFFAYAGRYTFNGDKVIHLVEISSIQNYVGKELVRTVKFQGDRMILITPPTSVNGRVQVVELVWERLPAGS